MNRILLISLLVTLTFLCIAIVFASHYKRINEQQNNRIQNLTNNVEILINRSKKDYADKVELAKRNEELEQEAAKDTSCFSWNTDISDSFVLRKLRQD